MKTLSNFILVLALIAFASPSLMAQATIDTTYYRYTFHRPPRYCDTMTGLVLPPMPPTLIDSVTGQEVLDPITGEPIPVCPNGLGFSGFHISPGLPAYLAAGDSWLPIFYPYKMSQQENIIYGLAVYLDNVSDFTVGDSVIFVLAERSHVTGQVTPFDTIVLKGGEVGVSRYLEIPLMPQDVEELRHSVHDNCIDSVKYARVMEFYLDSPHLLDGDSLFICHVFNTDHHSIFNVAHIDETYLTYYFPLAIFYESIWGYYWETWGTWTSKSQAFYTPITEPLPDWEIPLLDTLIPMPTKPDSPDPGDPEDPNNPNDPNNPDNPEDPEDPTDPEAIDGVYGRLPISIYPNPTDGMTTISSPEAIKELSVTDLAGRVLLHQSSLGTTTTLDTAPLEPGLYLLKVTTASGTATTKLAVR